MTEGTGAEEAGLPRPTEKKPSPSPTGIKIYIYEHETVKVKLKYLILMTQLRLCISKHAFIKQLQGIWKRQQTSATASACLSGGVITNGNSHRPAEKGHDNKMTREVLGFCRSGSL